MSYQDRDWYREAIRERSRQPKRRRRRLWSTGPIPLYLRIYGRIVACGIVVILAREAWRAFS